MSQVEEIEAAIEALPAEEFHRLVRWVVGMDQRRWNQQMDRNATSGRLERISEEAESEARRGLLRTWPPSG